MEWLELALLDYSMLRWSYSTLAAAAIVAAHLTTRHGQQASASASPMEASCYEVCKKYAGVEWSQVSLYPALQPQQVLAYLAGQ
ncbi:cyclin, C-terminal domain [Haematococcus lacustris]|uniref:Cyclin, C-terminal domain n=1 Tax=Haematococcus lacustris TaxID=44745 RepID=A0A699YFU5_HAELA|nr:cyclin, C-terminal domain [Haematococcus lacustris]